MQLRNFAVIFTLSAAAGIHPGQTALAINPGTPWPATDALSRSMAGPAESPPAGQRPMAGDGQLHRAARPRRTLLGAGEEGVERIGVDLGRLAHRSAGYRHRAQGERSSCAEADPCRSRCGDVRADPLQCGLCAVRTW